MDKNEALEYTAIASFRRMRMAGRLCGMRFLTIIFLGAIGAMGGKNPGEGGRVKTCTPPNANAASTGQSSRPAFLQRVKTFVKDVARGADRLATYFLAQGPPVAALGPMPYVPIIGDCHYHYCTATIVHVSYASPSFAIGVTTAECINRIEHLDNANGLLENEEPAKVTDYSSQTSNDVGAVRMQIQPESFLGKDPAALPQENDFQHLNSSDVYVADWYPADSISTATAAKIVPMKDCLATPNASPQPQPGLFDNPTLCVKVTAILGRSSFKNGAPLYYIKSRTENVFLGMYKGQAQVNKHHIFFNMRHYTHVLTEMVASLRQ